MLYGKAADFSDEASTRRRTKKSPADQYIEQNSPPILERIAAADKTAVEECINRHGSLVWALAKHFTTSTEEAERAAQEIFLDIWKCAERFDSVDCEETDFIILIARRWLIKRKLQSALASAAANYANSA